MRQLAPVLLIIGLAGGLSGAPLPAQADLAAAIFTVNSTADAVDDDPGDGTCETAPGNHLCTLRAAIQETNALGGANTVVLPARPPGQVYLLTLAGGEEQAAATGDLDITSQLTLKGGGAASTIVDANALVTNDRGIEIQAGAALTLTGVTLRHGRHTEFGGGLANYGRLTLSDSYVLSNTVQGIALGGGGGLYNDEHAVSSLQRTLFQDNETNQQGGAIWSGGVLTITTSLIVSNTAQYEGGGIYTYNGITLVRDSSLEHNAAGSGGGFSATGVVDLVLHGAAILFNTADAGGGGYVAGGGLLVRNSTVSGNVSDGDGGGLLLSLANSASLMNATVTGNTAGVSDQGGGLMITSAATVFMRNSLLSGNVHRTGSLFSVFDDCSGTINSQDYNLVRTLTGCTITGPDTPGLLGVTPTFIGSLGQHGGPTPTLELLPGSNAIDAAHPMYCADELGAPLLTDQRGFVTRAVDGDGDQNAICDIGAFELGAHGPLLLPLLLR